MGIAKRAGGSVRPVAEGRGPNFTFYVLAGGFLPPWGVGWGGGRTGPKGAAPGAGNAPLVQDRPVRISLQCGKRALSMG